jgi:hypothetical protein
MHNYLNRAGGHIPTILLAAVTIAWCVVVGVLAEVKLHNLASSWGYDLAFFHNLLFNTIHGDWFVQSSSPHEASGLFGLHHTYPILLGVLPIYAVLPRVDTLLWLQVAAVASSAIPVARLARRAGASPGEAVTVAGCHLLQMPLLMTALCDFRPIVLSIPLLLWTMALALEDRRLWAFALTAATLTVREDMVYLLVVIGAALAVLPVLGARRPWIGAGIGGIAILYWVIITGIGGEFTYYFDPGEIGRSGAPDLDAPIAARAGFLVPYAAPFGLGGCLAIPLLAPGGLVGSYLLVLSPYEWADWSGVYGHHTAPLIASVSGAAAVGWARVLRRLPMFRRRHALAALVVVQVLVLIGLTPARLRQTTSAPGMSAEQVDEVRGLLDQIGEDEAVASDYRTMALLSGRRTQYAVSDFRFTEADRFPHSGADFPPGFEHVDVVLLQVEEEPRVAKAARECASFSRVDAAAGYELYRRTAPGGESCSASLR